MSLEEALKANTAALEGQTAVIREQNDLLKGAMARATAGRGTTAENPKGMTAVESENRREPEAAKPDAGKTGRGGKSGKTGKTDTPAIPTIEDLRKLAGDYLQVKDKAEKEARKEFIGTINEHFGVERVTETPDEHRAQVIAWISARIKDPTFEIPTDGASGDDEASDGGDSLI